MRAPVPQASRRALGTGTLERRLSVTSAKTDDGVARQFVAGAELSGAVAAVRRWRRWWMVRTGSAMATVMPCVLQVEAQKGRGRTVRAAVEICRAPTGPICRSDRSGTQHGQSPQLTRCKADECRSSSRSLSREGRSCRWPKTESVSCRGPRQRRPQDRVGAGPKTESVRCCRPRSAPGRGPSQRRPQDRVGAGPRTAAAAGCGPSQCRAARAADRRRLGWKTDESSGRTAARAWAEDRRRLGANAGARSGRRSAKARAENR
jgi:hypothetical protein